MNLDWVVSAGAPLLCAPPTAVRMWRGTRGNSVGGVEADYDRACKQSDYVGVIPCGPSHVLVLGDEPLQSTFVLKADQVLVVRWVSCLSTEHAVDAIDVLPSVLPALGEPTKFRLDESGLIMFDAALFDVDPSSCARVELRPGVLLVTTERYQRQGAFEFLVHRFLYERAH